MSALKLIANKNSRMLSSPERVDLKEKKLRKRNAACIVKLFILKYFAGKVQVIKSH